MAIASTTDAGTAAARFLERGFRPFFLAGALWSVVALAAWLAILTGRLDLPTGMAPLDWHVHEMLYGYAVAVIAGFLLTAIPNWTGRPPVGGVPLAGLALTWLAGRIACAGSAWSGGAVAAVVDLAFLAALFAVMLRELLAAGNRRNLPVAAALAALFAGNGLMHAEVAGIVDAGGAGGRLGLAVVVMLIGLVGGRIVPAFTRNWLTARGATRLPAPSGRIDATALAASGLALAGWVAWPGAAPVAPLLALAALLQAARLSRWGGARTLAEPLVWVLHLGYAWLPAGLGLLAAAEAGLLPAPTAIHALTAGAIGTMTLAVMTRATLGHTGAPLAAGPATVAIYAAVTLAALARVAAPLLPEAGMALLVLSAAAWIAAFGGFALLYGPRLAGRPGSA